MTPLTRSAGGSGERSMDRIVEELGLVPVKAPQELSDLMGHQMVASVIVSKTICGPACRIKVNLWDGGSFALQGRDTHELYRAAAAVLKEDAEGKDRGGSDVHASSGAVSRLRGDVGWDREGLLLSTLPDYDEEDVVEGKVAAHPVRPDPWNISPGGEA